MSGVKEDAVHSEMKLGAVTSLSTVIVPKSEVSDHGETSTCLTALAKLAGTSMCQTNSCVD